ncbi:MAG: PPOX class F420-dependent oxidoreductase [Candidatus Binatia bacterium]|nr:PPOX class F420-dependent oxidoreductase [Candidatus Binatia bacterium]
MAKTELADETYVSLETFKRDGTGVKTPVWAAPLDGTMVIFTEGSSYKVKRVRQNPKVRVAACDARGGGARDWVPGTCEVVPAGEHEDRAYQALRAKYGWQMTTVDFFSWLFGRIDGRVVLAVKLDEAAS